MNTGQIILIVLLIYLISHITIDLIIISNHLYRTYRISNAPVSKSAQEFVVSLSRASFVQMVLDSFDMIDIVMAPEITSQYVAYAKNNSYCLYFPPHTEAKSDAIGHVKRDAEKTQLKPLIADQREWIDSELELAKEQGVRVMGKNYWTHYVHRIYDLPM